MSSQESKKSPFRKKLADAWNSGDMEKAKKLSIEHSVETRFKSNPFAKKYRHKMHSKARALEKAKENAKMKK